MIIPVILSGGSGTRLWPLSRKSYPKQFLPLVDSDSLFQQTLTRLQGLDDCVSPLIICNEAHRFLVAEQLRQIDVPALSILLEPIGRNTAPAVACAALRTQEDAVLLVMPSDHIIENSQVFYQQVGKGLMAAQAGNLVTFGVVAKKPETGFGYIRRADEKLASIDVYPVAEFVEKPDLDTARTYVDSGDYYWNSGIFMFRADVYLQQLENYYPEILVAAKAAVAGISDDLDFHRLEKNAFSECPAESIDYAVMEKTDKAVVVPMDAGWNDVGSWSALQEIASKDANGNAIMGDIQVIDSKNCYLRAEHNMVAAVGVEDLIIVETADAVLVADKDRVQDVKQLVEKLQNNGRCEHQTHVRVYRPWGDYETIDESLRYKVKRIVVQPGESLSLQMHHHRAEHWVVVKGTAKVTKADEEMVLKEDQSVYIPLGTPHRLENPGLLPLEIIEVQTGSYLGEDDIVRFQDVYGRNVS